MRPVQHRIGYLDQPQLAPKFARALFLKTFLGAAS
jgi:hypothetical protein